MDINAAIEAYSSAGGNRIAPLEQLCRCSSVTAAMMAAEISTLQENILDLVRARSGANGLSRPQIEQIAAVSR
jgi:hypothetical protein